MDRRDKKFVVGNWKMNHNLEQIKNFISEVVEQSCHQWVAPQSIHLNQLKSLSANKDFLKSGSQNHSEHDSGAFTGENSLTSLKELGIHFTIVGHSERRQIFKENHQILSKKLIKSIELDITSIFCIGETLEQREENLTNDVLKEQLIEGLSLVKKEHLNKLIIAYEPVWAIGTGKTATAETAQQAHSFVRKTLVEKFGNDANDIPILYGGSVKPANIAELLNQADIDGGLVGGASLTAESYNQLCSTASNII